MYYYKNSGIIVTYSTPNVQHKLTFLTPFGLCNMVTWIINIT